MRRGPRPDTNSDSKLSTWCLSIALLYSYYYWRSTKLLEPQPKRAKIKTNRKMEGSDLSPEQKLALVKDQLQEVLHEDILENVILKEKRPLIIYWGTATTGRPHCGYFVPMIKIAHFLRAGCRVKILLADVHGFMDAGKSPIELVKFRAEYYKFVIQALLRAIGVSLEQLEFVLGSEYQLGKKDGKYPFDLLSLLTKVTEAKAKHAGAEVVKQAAESPLLSSLVYPLMQALDEEHLGVDAQFGGVDQRKIFALAQEVLPKLGYRERAHLMNPMVPGLAGGKMSASDPDSKIDILDTADAVRRKLKKAHCGPKEIEGNGIVSFVEYVLLPISVLNSPDGKTGHFVVEQRDGAEPLIYTNIASLKSDYEADRLTPQLLKSAVTNALVNVLAPIQKEFVASTKWQEIEKDAYPPTEAPKKEKKKKDKGTRHPGVHAKPDGSVEGPNAEQVTVGTSAEDRLESLPVRVNGS